GVASAIALLFTGPAAPLILLAAAVVTAANVWPEFGNMAKTAFATLDGAVAGVIELMGNLLTAIGDVASAFAEMMTGSAEFNAQVVQSMDAGHPGANFDAMSGGDVAGGMPNGGSNSTGTALADGIVNGFSARLAERLPEVQAAVQTVTDMARATLGVQSPSTVFAEIGEFVGQGLANGIASTQGIVAAAVGTMGKGAVAANDQMVNGILGGLNTLFGESKQVGAGLALVSTMIGAAKELQKGTFGFASAARVIAQGMAFVKTIKGAKKGGGGGGMAGGSEGKNQSESGGTYMNFQFTGGLTSSEQMGRFMVSAINQAVENGAVIKGARIA
ncbi:MAG: hypothetical protein ACEQSU_14845, partial [Microgenomates group bacterium]